MTVKNKVQLITYADSLGGDLKTLDNVPNILLFCLLFSK